MRRMMKIQIAIFDVVVICIRKIIMLIHLNKWKSMNLGNIRNCMGLIRA